MFVFKKVSSILSSLLVAFVWMGAVPASAQQAPSQFCLPVLIEVDNQDVVFSCDIEVLKEVSINGGTFVPADTAGAAANALVGDTVTWRITLNDEGFGYMPYLDVVVADVLPAGVTYVSHTASIGDYDQTDWVIPTATPVDGEEFEYTTNLPAVLTITTTANAVGIWENNAALTGVYCDGLCDYGDSNEDNDSNSAFITVTTSSTPQVLGDTTSTPQVLAATGARNMLLASATGVSLVGATLVLHRITHKSTRR